MKTEQKPVVCICLVLSETSTYAHEAHEFYEYLLGYLREECELKLVTLKEDLHGYVFDIGTDPCDAFIGVLFDRPTRHVRIELFGPDPKPGEERRKIPTLALTGLSMRAEDNHDFSNVSVAVDVDKYRSDRWFYHNPEDGYVVIANFLNDTLGIGIGA